GKSALRAVRRQTHSSLALVWLSPGDRKPSRLSHILIRRDVIMIETLQKLAPSDRVRVSGRYELGIGEVLRVSEAGGLYVADVVFESRAGRRLETLPVERLEKAVSPWQKLRTGNFDNPKDFLLRQLA